MTGESTDPHDLNELDPAQFVGAAPAGDASPGEFVSNDVSAQSEQAPARTDDADPTDQQEDPDPQEDA